MKWIGLTRKCKEMNKIPIMHLGVSLYIKCQLWNMISHTHAKYHIFCRLQTSHIGKVSSSFFPAYSNGCRNTCVSLRSTLYTLHTPSKHINTKSKGLICYMIWMNSRTVAHAIAIISMVPNNLDFYPSQFYSSLL